MKSTFKNLFLLLVLIILCQSAFAQRVVTPMAGAYFNRNEVLLNPDAEIGINYWTNVAGVYSTISTDYYSGRRSFQIVLSGQVLDFSSKTATSTLLKGAALTSSCRIKNGIAGAQMCQIQNNSPINCQAIPVTATWDLNLIPATFTSGTTNSGLLFRTNVPATGTIKIDNCTVSESYAGAGAGLTSLNGLLPSTQLFASGTAGADFNISSLVNTHTFNIPYASSVNTGKLSSADWLIFNQVTNGLDRTLWVDFTGGNDTTGTGTISNPYKTVFKANTVISGLNTSAQRWTVMIASGIDTEPTVTLLPWVSYWGAGADSTALTNGVAYTGGAGETSRIDISGLRIDSATLDLSASINVNIRVFHCIMSFSWNGGPDYPTTQANNFLSYGSQFGAVSIIDGAVHLYNTLGIFSSLTIGDGPAVNSVPFMEMTGGLLQGAVSLSGKASLYARGILNQSTMTGTIASGVTPLFETDNSSLPSDTKLVGDWRVQNDDLLVKNSAIDVTVQREGFIGVDTSAGNRIVTLPKSANYKGMYLEVKKITGDASIVTLTPNGAETIGGSSTYSLKILNESVKLLANPNGLGWYISNNLIASGDYQIGSLDAFSRNQIWNKAASSILRLGSWSSDGDAANVLSEGIVSYGDSLTGLPIDAANGGYARIKPNRFGLFTIDSTLPAYLGGDYYFRVDNTSLFLKDNLAVKTFEVVRSSGNTSVGGTFLSKGIAKFDEGIQVKTGANKTIGSCTLVAGSCPVLTNKVTASSLIFLTAQNSSGVDGAVKVSARVVGTSFTITSSNALDTSDVAWIIIDSY